MIWLQPLNMMEMPATSPRAHAVEPGKLKRIISPAAIAIAPEANNQAQPSLGRTVMASKPCVTPLSNEHNGYDQSESFGAEYGVVVDGEASKHGDNAGDGLPEEAAPFFDLHGVPDLKYPDDNKYQPNYKCYRDGGREWHDQHNHATNHHQYTEH